jgi:hypothetical protein
VLVELRRALLGRRESWPAVRALVRPSSRPAPLGLGKVFVPR